MLIFALVFVFSCIFPAANCQHFDNIDIQVLRDLKAVKLQQASTVENEIEATDIVIENQSVGLVKTGSFAHLGKLKSIKLRYDSIERIERGAFTNLTKLRLISVNFNRLKRVESQIFYNLSITELNLLGNEIEELDEDSFNTLRDLEVLILKSNRIQQLPARLLSAITNLKQLDLSHNRIESIPGDFLNGVFATNFPDTILDLSHNRLEYLGVKSINGLSEISEIHLNNNKLKNVDPEVFENVNISVHLDLEGNSLTTLSRGSLVNLRHTDFVNVFVNPWKCEFVRRYMSFVQATGKTNTIDLNLLEECWP